MWKVRLFKPLIVTVLLTQSATVLAAPLQVLAVDKDTCQDWATSKDDPDLRKNHIAWVRGFLTGHNYANQSHQVAEVSNGTVELYVTSFCRQKPLASLLDAASRMSDEYSGRKTPITK